ncbi:MAG: hypothetical protein JWQ68_1369 [Cryobacterium sp.]|nr:hypothetical protein [Cryobacterium sp.]
MNVLSNAPVALTSAPAARLLSKAAPHGDEFGLVMQGERDGRSADTRAADGSAGGTLASGSEVMPIPATHDHVVSMASATMNATVLSLDLLAPTPAASPISEATGADQAAEAVISVSAAETLNHPGLLGGGGDQTPQSPGATAGGPSAVDVSPPQPPLSTPRGAATPPAPGSRSVAPAAAAGVPQNNVPGTVTLSLEAGETDMLPPGSVPSAVPATTGALAAPADPERPLIGLSAPQGAAALSGGEGPRTDAAPAPAPAAALSTAPTGPGAPSETSVARSTVQQVPLTAQVSGPLSHVFGKPGEHVLTVSVTPDNVGPITVRAHVTADAIRVELFAPTDLGREALRAILPDLRRDLAGSGLASTLDLSSQNSASNPDRESRRDRQTGWPSADARRESERSASYRGPAALTYGATSTIDVMA